MGRSRSRWSSRVDQGDVTGFILVWARAGYLSAVEHAWVTDEMPAEFPRPEWLRRWDSTTDRT